MRNNIFNFTVAPSDQNTTSLYSTLSAGIILLALLWIATRLSRAPLQKKPLFQVEYNAMLKESTDFLKTRIHRADLSRIAFFDLLKGLEKLKNNTITIKFEENKKAAVAAWVARGDAHTILLNSRLKEKFLSDEKYLKKCLLHESIHLIGFPHGENKHEFAYPISSLIYDDLPSIKKDCAREILKCEQTSEDAYIDAFIRFFRDASITFSCGQHAVETTSILSSNIHRLMQKPDPNFHFIREHLEAIGTEYAKRKIADWVVRRETKTVHGLGEGLKDPGSKPIGKIAGNRIYGFR